MLDRFFDRVADDLAKQMSGRRGFFVRCAGGLAALAGTAHARPMHLLPDPQAPAPAPAPAPVPSSASAASSSKWSGCLNPPSKGMCGCSCDCIAGGSGISMTGCPAGSNTGGAWTGCDLDACGRNVTVRYVDCCGPANGCPGGKANPCFCTQGCPPSGGALAWCGGALGGYYCTIAIVTTSSWGSNPGSSLSSCSPSSSKSSLPSVISQSSIVHDEHDDTIDDDDNSGTNGPTARLLRRGLREWVRRV